MSVRRVLLAAAAAAWLAPSPCAHAHHVPGHGASEGVRSINSLGSRGARAQSRLLLLQEFGHDTTSLNPGQRYTTSLLGEFAPIPEFSFGAQAPLVVLDEVAAAPRVGYGDTRVLVRYTPHARKLIHRVLTLGVSASFPTRTIKATTDPGRIWSVSPNLFYTRTYTRLFWQAMGLATMETRPAGTAIDLAAGAQVGGRFAENKIAPGAGVLVETRVATWCAAPGGGSSLCDDGRASETDRETGSTRAAIIASFAYNFATWGGLTLALQVPFTPKRDFDVGASVGFQAIF